MASIDERMFGEFEDLEETASNSNNNNDIIDDEPITAMDALSMTQNELLQEMERRGLHASGFLNQNAMILQAEFDKENESYVAQQRKERHEAKLLASKQAGLQKRRMLMESQIREEQVSFKVIV